MRWLIIPLIISLMSGCIGDSSEPALDANEPSSTDANPGSGASGDGEPSEASTGTDSEANTTPAPQITRGSGGSALSASPPGAIEHTSVGILTEYATEFEVPADAVALVAEMRYTTAASTGAALDLYPPGGEQITSAGDLPPGPTSGDTIKVQISNPDRGNWRAQGNADGIAAGLSYDVALTVFFEEPPADYTAF